MMRAKSHRNITQKNANYGQSTISRKWIMDTYFDIKPCKVKKKL